MFVNVGSPSTNYRIVPYPLLFSSGREMAQCLRDDGRRLIAWCPSVKHCYGQDTWGGSSLPGLQLAMQN